MGSKEEREKDMEKNVSRRDFLGSMGAMAAVAGTGAALSEYVAAKRAQADEAAEVTGDASDSEYRAILTADQLAEVNPVTGDGATTALRAGIPSVKGSANPMFQGPADPICTKEEAQAWIANQPMVTEPYTTPGGKVIPAAYINLRNRWNRQGLGCGSDADTSEDCWDWFMYNFSEREA